MPKIKRKKPAVKKSPSLFKKHPNLKWLLPLLIATFVGFILVTKHKINDNDPSGDKSGMIKQEIKQKLNLDNDKETIDDSPTASPTQ